MINSDKDTETANFLYLPDIIGCISIRHFGNYTGKLREKHHSAVNCSSVISGISEYIFVTLLNDVSAK
jgi:hypothetical protein